MRGWKKNKSQNTIACKNIPQKIKVNKDNKKIKLQNIKKKKKSKDLKLAPKRISQGREHERKTKFKSILIRMFGINERFVSLEWRR